MEVSKCWKIVEFPKISIKIKKMKNILWSPNSQRSEINYSISLQPTPHPIKFYYLSGTKISLRRYGEIHRYLLQECSCWASRDSAVQFFFWHQTEAPSMENLQSQKVFWLCCESMLFSMSIELRFAKWLRFFEQNCIIKRLIFSGFETFC